MMALERTISLSFYSILVRLKAGDGLCVPVGVFGFLFHTGSIKSARLKKSARDVGRFLFHTGSIKRGALNPR